MAHECPDCGSQCHCGGDIDDLLLNDDDDINGCTHCPHDKLFEDEDYDDFDANEV